MNERLGPSLLALAALATASCAPPAPTEGSKLRIALVVKTLNNPFFLDMERGALEAAERLGVELVVQAAERELDVEKQLQIIENLIQTRVDALCVTPAGSREIVSAVAKANAADIPFLIVDTRIDAEALGDNHIATFIGSDNYQGGRVAGQYVVDRLDAKARVAILEGIPGHETGDSRLRGFKDAVEGQAGIEIVASQPANWERDQGFNVFQNVLQAHPDVDTLFACNDLMALGALEAIDAAGRSGEIRVIGFDAVEEARAAVAEGRMLGTVAQFPGEMGRVAIESAVALLNGQTVPEEIPVRIELVTRSAETKQ